MQAFGCSVGRREGVLTVSQVYRSRSFEGIYGDMGKSFLFLSHLAMLPTVQRTR